MCIPEHWLPHYRYRFDAHQGPQAFTEDSPGAVDIGDVNMTTLNYNTSPGGTGGGVWIQAWPPPAGTSITSVSIAVQNANSSEFLSLDFTALASLGFTVTASGSETILGLATGVRFATVSGGQTGQPLLVTLERAAAQTTAQPGTTGPDLPLLDQILDYVLYRTDSQTPPSSRVVEFSFRGSHPYGNPTTQVVIQPLNDQPVLTGTGPALGTIGEHATNSFEVSSLLPAFTDPDGPGAAGIAVRGLVSNNGR